MERSHWDLPPVSAIFGEDSLCPQPSWTWHRNLTKLLRSLHPPPYTLADVDNTGAVTEASSHVSSRESLLHKVQERLQSMLSWQDFSGHSKSFIRCCYTTQHSVASIKKVASGRRHNKSQCRGIYTMSSFQPSTTFFLCLAMLVSGILLFPFFASDYNLQCKENTKTLWPFFLQVPLIVIL